jgi:hypothetical protein
MMSSSAPARIGFVHPHSRIEAAIRATCSRLCVRGLFARGIKRSIGQRSIWMSILIGVLAGAFFAIHPSIANAGFSRQQSISRESHVWVFVRGLNELHLAEGCKLRVPEVCWLMFCGFRGSSFEMPDIGLAAWDDRDGLEVHRVAAAGNADTLWICARASCNR